MSALCYYLTPDILIISMDTLSTRGDTHVPVKYTTKIYPLPHMNCVICGTGEANALIDWYVFVMKSIISNGIFQLDRLTSRNIQEFMRSYTGHSTIYQFGLSEVDGLIHGYAYRSENKYVSEKLMDNSLGLKPDDAFQKVDGHLNSDILETAASIPEALSTIMHKQKEFDDNLPILDRVGIGGYVQIYILNKNGYSITNYDKFEDYGDLYDQMLLDASEVD